MMTISVSVAAAYIVLWTLSLVITSSITNIIDAMVRTVELNRRSRYCKSKQQHLRKCHFDNYVCMCASYQSLTQNLLSNKNLFLFVCLCVCVSSKDRTRQQRDVR